MQRGQDAMLVHSLTAGVLVLCLLAEESKLHVFPASGQGGGGRKLCEEWSKEKQFSFCVSKKNIYYFLNYQGWGSLHTHDMNKGTFRGQGGLIPWNWSYCRPQNGCWESNSVPARAVHTLDHLSHLSSSQENSFLVKTGSARSLKECPRKQMKT